MEELCRKYCGISLRASRHTHVSASFAENKLGTRRNDLRLHENVHVADRTLRGIFAQSQREREPTALTLRHAAKRDSIWEQPGGRELAGSTPRYGKRDMRDTILGTVTRRLLLIPD